MGKYHNRYLFDYSGEAVAVCLRRLSEQPTYYKSMGSVDRLRMQVRALFMAAFTLNATAIWTAKLLHRGVFSMRTQRLFFVKRWRKDPREWGDGAKSCFARALCGYATGEDGVCVDRHLERMGLRPKSAEEQWRDWFRLYESMYGPGEAVLCIRWHVEVLDWIALTGKRPAAWK